jgi:hypothetical protein
VPGPSVPKFEIAIEKLKIYKSPRTDQIPAELIKAGGKIIRSEINKRINSIRNNEELPADRKETITVPIYKKDEKTYFSNYTDISLLPTT